MWDQYWYWSGPMYNGPENEAWRNHLDAATRAAVLQARQADLLWALSGRCPDDIELHAATLDVLDPSDARRSIVTGRLAAAMTD